MSYFGIPIRNGVPIGLGALAPLASQAAAAPSLSLNFTSGVLDSRVTFTRASTGTYYNSSGVLTSAAINEARFDYNPTTLAPRGLLIEEQRANSLTYSEQFNNVIWVKSRASITANAVNSPDGTLTGDKLVEDTTASNTHFVSQTVTNANAAYTYSVYVKAAERNVAFVGMTDGVTALSGAFIDLSTGVLTNSTGGSWTSFSSISTSVGNGWWKVSVTATRGAGTTTGCNIYPCLNVGSISYTGDGTSGIYIWGAQLEAGAFPTSYIPTTAAAATRAADVAVITGTNFSSWYNATEGTLCTSVVTATTTTVGAALSINDNTSSNAIQIYYFGSAQYQVVTGGVSQATLAATSTGTFKAAGAYKVNAFAASFNGAAATTDTSGTIPTVSQLRIGALGGGSSHLNGTIKYIAYYPRRLSNAQLQALTV